MMDELDDLLEGLGSEYTDGYGPSPIPSRIDDEVKTFLSLMDAADPDHKDAVLSLITERHGFLLLGYAERIASRMVRQSDVLLFQEALPALSMAIRLVDAREVLLVMSLLFRSGQKLDLNPQDLSSMAVGFANDALLKFLTDFMRRTDEDRCIEAMGYIEGEDADGFRYIRTW